MSVVKAYGLLQIQGRPFTGAGDGGTREEACSHLQLGPHVLLRPGLPQTTCLPRSCSNRTFTGVSSGDTRWGGAVERVSESPGAGPRGECSLLTPGQPSPRLLKASAAPSADGVLPQHRTRPAIRLKKGRFREADKLPQGRVVEGTACGHKPTSASSRTHVLFHD